MKPLFNTDLFATGLTIFAMFFGAGNIIYPLALGQFALDQTHFAIIGLLMTAVIVPFCGLLAMFLFNGEIRPFFGRIGMRLGLCLAFFIIALLGPLGSTPRCIALSFSTFNLAFPGASPLIFNAVACGCLFFVALKKQRIVGLFGYVLTPLLLALLAFIVIKGLWEAPGDSIALTGLEGTAAAWAGLKEGYNTMDLLAAFFFAPVIISFTLDKTGDSVPQDRFQFVLKASLIGASLLAIVYIGFAYLAAWYAPLLEGLTADQLLGVIAIKIAGPHAGILVCLTVVLACLTTAIALISAFTDFVHKELLGGRYKYSIVLGLSSWATFFVSCFEFQGISQFLTPILEVFYPFLIVLTGYHLIEKLFDLKQVKQET